MIYKKAVSHFKKDETPFFEWDRCFCLLYPLISDQNNNLKCCILRTLRGSCWGGSRAAWHLTESTRGLDLRGVVNFVCHKVPYKFFWELTKLYVLS